jgi:hypothetical protein
MLRVSVAWLDAAEPTRAALVSMARWRRALFLETGARPKWRSELVGRVS